MKAFRLLATSIANDMTQHENGLRRPIGMILVLFGFLGVSSVLLQWVPGLRQNVLVFLIALFSLFVGRHLSIQVGGSAAIVARSATATIMTLLFIAAIIIAIIAAAVMVIILILSQLPN